MPQFTLTLSGGREEEEGGEEESDMLGLKVGTDGRVEGRKSAVTTNNIDAANTAKAAYLRVQNVVRKGAYTHQNNDGDPSPH